MMSTLCYTPFPHLLHAHTHSRPNGAKTGTGLNTTNLFDEDAVFPTLRKAGYKTAFFGKIHNGQEKETPNF